MSSISSASGTGLAQFFQSLAAGTGTKSTTAAAAPSATSATGSTDATTSTSTDGTEAPKAERHHGHHGGGRFFQKVQSAVTDALQASKSDPSADPNKVVQDAIAKALQDLGGASGPDGAKGAAGANGAPPSPPAGKGPPDGADPSASGTSSAGNDARQAFFQTLQGYGIDPAQFRADFVAAAKTANGSDAEPTAALSKFPPGTALDTTA